ncbi:hypothetical protein HDU98_002578 [Podochytrium sp. JEL0797]|nr:hypothetical protein HDU98_002578 [Podochytrium sp. JEL0797]
MAGRVTASPKSPTDETPTLLPNAQQSIKITSIGTEQSPAVGLEAPGDPKQTIVDLGETEGSVTSAGNGRVYRYWAKFRSFFGSKTPSLYDYNMLTFLQWQTSLSLGPRIPKLLHRFLLVSYHIVLLLALFLFSKYSSLWGPTLYVIYWQIAKFALPKPSQFIVEMSILFVGMVWFGFHLDMLSNTTIPIYSVSAKLFSNPASLVPLVCVLVVIGLAVLAFAYIHFKQGTLFSYVVGYPAICLVYALLPRVIGLNIHLHHYLYGLLLLPITRLKSRVSVVSLGLLLGLFTQGVLKYGFASPFDTSLQANAIYTQSTVQTQWNMTSADISQGMIRWVYPFNQTVNITDLYTEDL